MDSRNARHLAAKALYLLAAVSITLLILRYVYEDLIDRYSVWKALGAPKEWSQLQPLVPSGYYILLWLCEVAVSSILILITFGIAAWILDMGFERLGMRDPRDWRGGDFGEELELPVYARREDFARPLY